MMRFTQLLSIQVLISDRQWLMMGLIDLGVDVQLGYHWHKIKNEVHGDE